VALKGSKEGQGEMCGKGNLGAKTSEPDEKIGKTSEKFFI
jgi:hypothetical protein